MNRNCIQVHTTHSKDEGQRVVNVKKSHLLSFQKHNKDGCEKDLAKQEGERKRERRGNPCPQAWEIELKVGNGLGSLVNCGIMRMTLYIEDEEEERELEYHNVCYACMTSFRVCMNEVSHGHNSTTTNKDQLDMDI